MYELSQTQECGVTNQIAPFAIKSLLLYIRVCFFIRAHARPAPRIYWSTWEVCVAKTTKQLWHDGWQTKWGQFWTDCSFKFKRDCSNSEDLLQKSDRGNKTIVGMIAIIKQVFWPVKSKLAFEFKTWNRKYAIIAFRCDNSLYTLLPDPFLPMFRWLGHETNSQSDWFLCRFVYLTCRNVKTWKMYCLPW